MFIAVLIWSFVLLFHHRASGKVYLCAKDGCNCTGSVVTCSNVKLQNFPNESSADFYGLDLSHNEIRSLDYIGNFSQLAELILSYNRIVHVNSNFFETAPNLQKLDLSHNNITALNDSNIFQKLSNLHFLDLGYNDLKSLPSGVFAPLHHLNFLDLSHNNVGDWFMQNRSGLSRTVDSLILDNTGLRMMDNDFFQAFTNLKLLSLTDNRLDEVPSLPLSIESLDISGNNLEVIEVKHFQYNKLKILVLNRLKRLKSIDKYAFYNMPLLEEVSVANCPNLRDFNELIFGVLSDQNTTKVKKLNLSGNGLTKLNATYRYLFQRLDSVDLTANPWTCDCNLLWIQSFNHTTNGENLTRCFWPKKLKDKHVFDLIDEDLPQCFPDKFRIRLNHVMLALLLSIFIIFAVLNGCLVLYTPTWIRNRGRGTSIESSIRMSRLKD